MNAPLSNLLIRPHFALAVDHARYAHRHLICAVDVLDEAGVAWRAAADDIAELIEDAGDFAEALSDILAGHPQRRPEHDGLPSFFASVAEDFRRRRGCR